MSFDIKRAFEIYEEEDNVTRAVKRHCKEIGIPYEEKYRRRLSYQVNLEEPNITSTKKTKKVYDDLDCDTSTETNQYYNDKESDEVSFMPSAWDAGKNRFLNIDEYCDTYGLPKEAVRSSKLVAHMEKHMIYNIAFNPTINEQTGIDKDFIADIISTYITSKVEVPKKGFGDDSYTDRLIITDIHIGMSTEGGRNVVPLYDGLWNEKVLYERLDELMVHVAKYQKSNTIIVDELGDYVDGLFGETTRKGHHLPQNMSDKECFKVAIKFKIDLIERLLGLYDKVICNNITEDNHSGVYGFFVNFAVKTLIDIKYPDNVEYNICEKFINHYSIGPHTFIISHGKDSEALKFGFKAILDTKQAEKIDKYCKEYRLYNGNTIEFSKGDSHQMILDYTTSTDFDYCSYPAFSRPSNWVKSNFGKSRSGFVMQNLDMKSTVKVNVPYFFED